MARTPKEYILLVLKGMGMGAADVVPGVSGGTIAFISGIYEEFIHSIKSVDFKALRILFKEGIGAFWKHINGWFLVAVFVGIAISIVSLAKLLEHLLEHEAVLLWSFFFGLIVASAIYVGKTVDKWNAGAIVGAVLGAVLAFWISGLEPPAMGCNDQIPSWYIVLSGAIAICAMIMPGISGSFILILMGAYSTVLGAITNKDFTIIGLFALGAIFGLVTFSRVLSWLFKNFRNVTIAVLTGFLVGSLNKIWPWKNVTATSVLDCPGADKVRTIATETNVLPNQFGEFIVNEATGVEALQPLDPQMLYAILLALAGFALLFVLERLAGKKPKEAQA